MTAVANARQDDEPDRSTRKIRAYEGLDRSVAAVALTPVDMFEKIGIPVSCPLAVRWWGYSAAFTDVLSGLLAQRPPSLAIHRSSNLTLSAVTGIAPLPFSLRSISEMRLTATWAAWVDPVPTAVLCLRGGVGPGRGAFGVIALGHATGSVAACTSVLEGTATTVGALVSLLDETVVPVGPPGPRAGVEVTVVATCRPVFPRT